MCPRGMSAEPPTGGRAVPAPKSRYGIVCNKSAFCRPQVRADVSIAAWLRVTRTVLQTRLGAQFAAREGRVCRGNVTDKTQSAICPPLGAPR